MEKQTRPHYKSRHDCLLCHLFVARGADFYSVVDSVTGMSDSVTAVTCCLLPSCLQERERNEKTEQYPYFVFLVPHHQSGWDELLREDIKMAGNT